MDEIARWVASLPDEWKAGCDGPVFAAAYACHQSPGRVYHAWSHVLDCVEKLRTFPCEGGQRVFLALLFHDAVYVPGGRGNEAQSARIAARLLTQHSALRDQDIERVASYIEATAGHPLAPSDASPELLATLDIDLSILGAAGAMYRAYAEGIRREYCPAITTEAGYRAGRMAFLSRLLARAAIFHTAEGIGRWEHAARENISGELQALS